MRVKGVIQQVDVKDLKFSGKGNTIFSAAMKEKIKKGMSSTA